MSDTILIRHEAPKGFNSLAKKNTRGSKHGSKHSVVFVLGSLKIWPSINTELNQPNEPHDI